MEPILPEQNRKKSYINPEQLSLFEADDLGETSSKAIDKNAPKKKSDIVFEFDFQEPKEKNDSPNDSSVIERSETGFCQDPSSTADFLEEKN